MNQWIKYLMAWTIPLSFLVSLKLGGLGGFFTVFYAFGILPFFELLLKPDRENAPM